MGMRHLLAGVALAAGLLAFIEPVSAKVVKFEVLRIESPAFEGRSFGSVGTYDRIIARATVAVSPTNPHNTIIADIDRAPRNSRGLVEATADVEILRPTLATNGNRRLLYDVVNRGNKFVTGFFNDSSGNKLSKPDDAGNGFLMSRGYTLVWSGWQDNVPAGDGRLLFSAPIVPQVTGLSREEFVFDNTENPTTATLSYPAADLDASRASLTVRPNESDSRATPTGLEFAFEGPNKVSIKRPAGFDAGAIYELIYLAKDPKVLGLGFAATRDIVSFLRRETGDAATTPNPIAARIDHAVAFGLSQSGRYLHDLLYLGFNEDEDGRLVFDGLMPHIAGGKGMFTNYRFAQPDRNVQQHANKLYPGAQFPFTYPVITDAVTGRTDGWLGRCLAAGNCPKIIQTDTQLEFYQSLASLVTTDTKGEPLAMPDNVRLFLLSSLQHAALANAKSSLTRTCTFPTNPLFAGPTLRALLVAMDEWIASAKPPPESRYPSRTNGTLVAPTAEAVGFPRIPGLDYKGVINEPTVIDYNVMPPAKGVAYPVFVPKADADGNDIAGVRLPTLAAPVATHLGWNQRKAGFAQGELCESTGSMLPFAKTREERQKTNDPRLSLAERYPNDGDRAAAIFRAAKQLVQDRLLLEEDVTAFQQTTN